MNRVHVPTKSPEDWRALLADPVKHWRKGYSAMSLAYCWEEAQGFPREVKRALAAHPALKDLELILAIPEYKVVLPGGGAASANDLFVLAKSSEGLVCMMVEGKVNEPFGPLVIEWFKNASPGKKKRLRYLCETTGLSEAVVQDVGYQLLHRTASAIIEADRFKASCAVMLVHSFSETKEWFEDFRRFAALFGGYAQPGKVFKAGRIKSVDLHLGWVSDLNEYGQEEQPDDFPSGTVVSRKCECCGHHEIGIKTEAGKFVPLKPGNQVRVIPYMS